MSESEVLARLNQVVSVLAEARTVDEVKGIRDTAKAAEVYAKQRQLGEAAIAYAREVTLRSERRLGEILQETPKNPGVRFLGGSQKEPPGNIPTLSELGLTKKDSMKAQQLALLPDEVFEQIVSGRVKLKNALRDLRRRDVEADVPPPTGKYDCLVIDPPWAYTLRDEDETHRNRCPYPVMSFSQILDLPIPELLPQGVLWLWTTNFFMADACRLLMGWECELKTLLTWVKVASTGSPHIGMGHWLRNTTEHCLLAVRGNPSSFLSQGTLTNHSTVLMAPRGEHSAKPEPFYALVEELAPNATRLEMFARSARPGWKVWGNQVEEGDE